MTYWKVTDKILKRDCQFLEMYIFMFVFSGLNLKVLFTDLSVTWNLPSEKGLNKKRKTFYIIVN